MSESIQRAMRSFDAYIFDMYDVQVYARWYIPGEFPTQTDAPVSNDGTHLVIVEQHSDHRKRRLCTVEQKLGIGKITKVYDKARARYVSLCSYDYAILQEFVREMVASIEAVN